MQRRAWVYVSLVCGSVAASGACAQIQGLDGFEKVACLDDCGEGGATDSPLADGPTADLDAHEVPDTSCTGQCNGACVDVTKDPNNCGACGTTCSAATTTCCNSACTDTKTSNTHCGGCGLACATTEGCVTGSCAVLPLGNGADGALAVAADTTIDTVSTGGLAASTAQRIVTVTATAGFTAGDLVMLHQTRGSGAGKYELATIEKIDAAAKAVTLVRTPGRAFTSAGDARAQMIRVPQYTTVTIDAGATLTAPAWDGTVGGILVLKATGAVTVAGAIDMSARGYRGMSHAAACAGGTRYACVTIDTANGFAGESGAGPSAAANGANGAGGGGGQDGQDCGGGAGGGYGTAGTSGPNGTGLVCRNGTQLGGAGGTAVGSADLDVDMLFGGAGGEGGGDEDGAYPGPGGNGGGIIAIASKTITVTGAIRADGAPGLDGVQVAAGCGGSGCGMGPGGGGGGGAIHVRAESSSLGVGLVTANGKGGGQCTCPGLPGGTGGDGRIAVAGPSSGTTSPALVAK
jgi:hypothetical protein